MARNTKRTVTKKRHPFEGRWRITDSSNFSAEDLDLVGPAYIAFERGGSGEMQMVAISRALLGGPGLVLFDEPSQGLAPKLVQDVMNTIGRLKGEGIAVLLVEQNVHSALAVADRVVVMDHGTVAHAGPARELREDDAMLMRLLGV